MKLFRQTSPEEDSYRRLLSKGWLPGGIIDVGAFQGDWTRLARRVWANVPILMVEAQEQKRPFMDAVRHSLRGVSYAQAVLGARSGETITFYEMETGSSYFPEQSNAPRKEQVYETSTLDEVAGSIVGPIFLKIDVQGAELEVLKGGQDTLERSEVVQLEVALLPYNKGAPTMLEVLSYMEQMEFVPLDVSGFSRPNLVDLVQIDVLFVRKSSDLRPTFINFAWHE
jgi:FkbM family methyltransferase